MRLFSLNLLYLTGLAICLFSGTVSALSIRFDPNYKMATLGGMVGEVEYGESDGKRTALVTLEGKGWHELIEFTIKDSFNLKTGSAVRIEHVKNDTLGATLTGCMVKVLAESTYNTAGEMELKQPDKDKYIVTEQVGDCHYSLEEELASNAEYEASIKNGKKVPKEEILRRTVVHYAFLNRTYYFKELIDLCERYFPPTVPALKKRIGNWQQDNEKMAVEYLAKLRELFQGNEKQKESLERLITVKNNNSYFVNHPDSQYRDCLEEPEDIHEGLRMLLKQMSKADLKEYELIRPAGPTNAALAYK